MFSFSSFFLQCLYASGRMIFLKWIWSCHSPSQKQPSWLLITPRKIQPPWDGTQQVYFPTWPASSTYFLSPMPHLPVTSHDRNSLALRLCSGSSLCLRGLPLYCDRSSTFRPRSYIKASWTLQVMWATLSHSELRHGGAHCVERTRRSDDAVQTEVYTGHWRSLGPRDSVT